MLGDAQYYQHRAAQQTGAAGHAQDSKARVAHLELALRYELLANAAATQDAASSARRPSA
jgi:hypothetical protein